MWQRFSVKAREVIFRAQEAAQRFGDGYISTEHLLLGLLADADNAAGEVLKALGHSSQAIRRAAEDQMIQGEVRSAQDMTLTPRAKRAIDLAHYEMRDLNAARLGTQHILLGLLREDDGLAGRILRKAGLELDRVRQAILALPESASESEAPIIAPKSEAEDGPTESSIAQALRDDAVAAMDDPVALNLLLKELFPDMLRVQRLLVHLAELRIPRDIAAEPEPISRSAVNRWEARIEREIGMSRAHSGIGLSIWAEALGKALE